MATSTTSTSSPSTSSITDIQQLQRWAQHADVTFQEINLGLTRLNNLLQQVITLNKLKSKP